jgi:hypothetical protein
VASELPLAPEAVEGLTRSPGKLPEGFVQGRGQEMVDGTHDNSPLETRESLRRPWLRPNAAHLLISPHSGRIVQVSIMRTPTG